MPDAMRPAPLPTARTSLFDPPPRLRELRETAPLSPLLYPDGSVGWLATTHALSRAILADPRFSARQELKKMPVPAGIGDQQRRPADPGMFIGMDAPEHTRLRRLYAGEFTARRIRRLEARVARITSGRLDAMRADRPPVDLVRSFALPIPSLTISEVLGVPPEHRDRFQRDATTAHALDSSPEEVAAAFDGVRRLLSGLVDAKRAHPADDLLSRLAASGGLSHEELVNSALLLLFAGYETTANMIALGTFALLCHPEQWALLVHGPDRVGDAVEELLRYLSIVHLGLVRAALEDVEIEGRLIRAGEVVTCSVPSVNRDPSVFGDAERLDITRTPGRHMAFGHGVHQCLGAHLARVEMRAALGGLAGRFPGLRLAVPADEVPMRAEMAFYGVHRLPVTWD
ncbi:cytochrome P450 [Streptomyces sp. NPDC049881]|uniref:cytochrome P450 n=1 Tax=Streptomyces sp. NPDC049881 TaxID=3155778 RepID=UPI003431508A